MLSFYEYWEYITVFLLAAIPWIELIVVIPLGVVGGLSPIVVAILAFAGNWLPIMLIILLYARWSQWRARKKAEKGEVKEKSNRRKRAKKIWDRYGLPGLALIGPFFVGTHITAVAAMAFGTRKSLVTFWMTFSLVAWTVAVTVAAYYGLDYLNLIRPEGFFN